MKNWNDKLTNDDLKTWGENSNGILEPLELEMFSNFIFYLSLIILGMFVMRFGIIQIRQQKQGKNKIKKKVLEQIAFGIFFIIILGLIIYSVNGLLFN